MTMTLRNKALYGLLAILVVASFSFLLIPKLTGHKWILVQGPSVKVTFGILRPGEPDTLKLGDYIMLAWQGVDPNEIEKLRGGARLIKRVACLPGQTLRVTLQEVLCDGVYIGHIRAKALSGKSIAPALYEGVIPPKLIFVMGDHYYSYDSRYFGLVPQEWIAGKIVRWI